ncbi:DMT family transporter [Pseudovibrio exalbescens]|uniref:EamA domain-containing protein n=1 Tax=Pseudovibrio exalbescens TaxID=197461 RepID=A0A1U7JJ24_9HYPH|nr:EamA family transporter [Pseudovibrio exalbescens]OKL44750.1 hypothetical protein A3843_06620 [Pseudovibrio exalbescens]
MSAPTSPFTKGIASILFAALVWGTTGTAATFAPAVGPIAIGAAAMTGGGLLQAAVALPGLIPAWNHLRQHLPLLVLGGFAVAVYPLAFYASMRLAGVAIGTVVSIGSAPLFAALLEMIFDGSRLTSRWMIGAALGVAGIALMAPLGHEPAASPPLATNSLGIGLGLGAGLTYALYSWVARRLMLHHIPTRTVMGALFGSGGLMLLPVLMATGAPFFQSWTNLAAGFYMAVVPMFLGYLAFGYGLARVEASIATTITLFEPVIATLLAVIVVGERLSLASWLGIGLVTLCLVWITTPAHRLTRVIRKNISLRH